VTHDPDFLNSPRLREYLAAELQQPLGAPPAAIDASVVEFLLGCINSHRGRVPTGGSGYDAFRRSTACLVATARRIALSQRASRRVTLIDMRSAYGRQFCKVWPFC
jgi:hypothetical protein